MWRAPSAQPATTRPWPRSTCSRRFVGRGRGAELDRIYSISTPQFWVEAQARGGRKHLTLALTFAYAEEALADVVADLLDRLHRLGISLRRLFLDREFASVAVLGLLAGQPFCSIVALPK